VFNLNKNKNSNSKEEKTEEIKAEPKVSQTKGIPKSIDECERLIKDIFTKSTDVVLETFLTHREKAMIVYVDGLVNRDLIDRDIVGPLKAIDFSGDAAIAIHSTFKDAKDMDDFVTRVLNGETAVFYEDSGRILVCELKQWDRRSVEHPDAENVVRGPKEGFNENFRTNTSLIRRKIRSPKLIIETLTIGKQTNTIIGLVYMDGIVNKNVLKELKQRLSKIDTDAILETGYIEQYIEEKSLSPIATIGLTQKPDVVAAKILEGRVAVVCDGTPHVLIVPQLFIENIHTSEDYYNRVLIAGFLRIIRVFSFFITILLPGLFVAIVTFNLETIPAEFFKTIVKAKAATPAPVGAEVFFLILMFELLKESGTRLPKSVGSAISIVGGLIIGDAAVSAGIVGAPVVIIVGLTAVTGFVVPNLSEFITLYRYLFLFLGGTMGLIGIGSGTLIMMTQLIAAESFGIPILSSFSKNELKDSFVRFPFKGVLYRPIAIVKDNIIRSKKYKQ
jgi:spore germination protein KA